MYKFDTPFLIKEQYKKLCKYCHSDLKEFDCTSLLPENMESKYKFLNYLAKVFLLFEVLFRFFSLLIVEKSNREKLKKAGKIKPV